MNPSKPHLQSISKYDLSDSETGERPLECGVLDEQHMVAPFGGVRAQAVPVNHRCMPEHLIITPDCVSLVRMYQGLPHRKHRFPFLLFTNHLPQERTALTKHREDTAALWEKGCLGQGWVGTVHCRLSRCCLQ